MPDTDAAQAVRAVMDCWKAGIDAHEPQRVAELFTGDAIFQGLRPYSVGPQGVAAYYDSQPLGMTVSYDILETRRVAAGNVLAYLNADFSIPDRPMISVRIGILVTQAGGRAKIAYYQASRIE
ncbi:nuclear transport factor 2 family protein [Mycobacterium asiaticum]|uniref:SnoaL-like domain-containing protein n=1 Tax=Mycobacterium asiaticum TaxID=1790 RepID=A0A1A3N0B7_MYCAS|nr:nuclear transport factor 2 family protein [Mycobacterium asiaticum]OBK14504.1 hypothetical protein A5636_07625 [Mycobacterium asiaticum]